MILKDAEIGYDDLTEFGRVTIERSATGICVTVDGFEFTEAQSCRAHNAKAMAWARDVLASQVEAVRLVPGGDVISCSGVDQQELDDERKRNADF
ncbi:phage capsid protein [Burkholderia cenocepacia]|uniref:phage capsid protein n=1 Tax=Burkholderia cenocepacia TaxID=95486 RepID=UPI001CF34927|nr:phage capsid protein [Burkholderia cenocepacia]MCA8237736.1 phage capsid protein [Burkholderia cenocepacia]